MHLVQKGELLAKIKEELTRLKKESSATDKLFDDFKKLIRILTEENKMDEEWEKFAIHFDKVNTDFLKSLKQSYQNLSANELKLCAYLLMNLSSKEIAQLMNISVTSIGKSKKSLIFKLMAKSYRIIPEPGLHNLYNSKTRQELLSDTKFGEDIVKPILIGNFSCYFSKMI
jgi:DNA-binding CsgD family transcriptional regulator